MFGPKRSFLCVGVFFKISESGEREIRIETLAHMTVKARGPLSPRKRPQIARIGERPPLSLALDTSVENLSLSLVLSHSARRPLSRFDSRTRPPLLLLRRHGARIAFGLCGSSFVVLSARIAFGCRTRFPVCSLSPCSGKYREDSFGQVLKSNAGLFAGHTKKGPPRNTNGCLFSHGHRVSRRRRDPLRDFWPHSSVPGFPPSAPPSKPAPQNLHNRAHLTLGEKSKGLVPKTRKNRV